MENFGKFIAVLLAMIIAPIIQGFVFVKLWLWFVVSTFGLHPLRIVQAIGIMFLINYITFKRDKETSDFWEQFAINIISLILVSSFALLSGWVVTLFM